MNDNFYYSFPAIRGLQANRDYYVIMCPFNILVKLFMFNEEDIPPEHRAQRILNKARIPHISRYMIDNPNDYVFSSLTASVDGDIKFESYDDSNFKNIGTLQVAMDSRLLINDGQHRKAAIEEALKENPDLGKETISVVLFIDEDLKRSQQMFSDLNKHAVNVSKSIGILYDSRDEIAILTKDIIKSIKNLNNFTDKERSHLAKLSSKLFTLSNIYKSNKKIIGSNTLDDNMKKFILEYWTYLSNNLKDWQFVFKKELSAKNFRESYVCSHGVILEAFGLIGNYVYSYDIKNWKSILKKLNKIDWNRNNLQDWQHRVISANGRITKSATSIKLASNLIKEKIDLPLTKDEAKLEENFKKGLMKK
ncbi:DNA sulfur modification protein DndB [Anaeromicrobium sediminis]|uniref:DNA sulfur modification protein DndB n=1 Tax=Anaeromicrobium sediminis TaxID=1478221 RepID=A0A267MNP3_9FIRM|nr:DNA sulfur modification protein DndB [Anaeromicrobium sediminis]PAB60538.1 DNA sulfur modification protein DndB [Anaeromicrobium sediminis]